MPILDNRALIKQLDRENFLSHILDMPDQLTEGFRFGDAIRLPASFAQSRQIVFVVSGESIPVALAIQALMSQYARIQTSIVSDYRLPSWVSSDTFVIAIDYQGNSEQVISAFRDAAKQKARLLAVSIEGELAREARRVRATHISLEYGSPARAAFCYIFSCLAIVLKKLDLLELKESIVTEAGVLGRSLLENISPEVAQYQNSAKQLAEKIISRKTLIVGSGPLIAMAKKWQIVFAATGKLISVSSVITEFNDTLINGVGYTPKGVEAPLIVMLQSKYDHPRNKLQQTLAYQVAQAHKILYEQVFMHPSGTLFGEIVLCSLLGDMVSYYIALLQNRDPSFLEASEYIKQHLNQQPMFDT